MSNDNNTPQYDVKTADDGDVLFGLGGQDWHTHTTTIRDNETGKTYTATNYDADKSRDAAWEQVKSDH